MYRNFAAPAAETSMTPLIMINLDRLATFSAQQHLLLFVDGSETYQITQVWPINSLVISGEASGHISGACGCIPCSFAP